MYMVIGKKRVCELQVKDGFILFGRLWVVTKIEPTRIRYRNLDRWAFHNTDTLGKNSQQFVDIISTT